MAGRWVTFDCFGTIVDWNTGLASALAEVFPELSRDEAIAAFHDAELEVKHDGGFRDYREVLAESVRGIARGVGREVNDDEADVIARRWPTFAPYADAAAGLGDLRDRGWRLAILTNCDDDLFAATRERLPVPFDEAVTAQSIHSYKPDLAHFDVFRERVSPDTWVHAANSWVHDIAPAAELGLPRIWVDRDDSGHDASLASERITGFADLADTVERHAGG